MSRDWYAETRFRFDQERFDNMGVVGDGKVSKEATVQYAKSMHGGCDVGFLFVLTCLTTAEQTLRPSAPQSSCLLFKDGDLDPLPDVSICCQMEWLIRCTLVDFV